MSAIWKPYDKRIYMDWLEKIKKEGVNLTEWEKRFVTDMDNKFKTVMNYQLTEAQHDKLEQIYAEKTP